MTSSHRPSTRIFGTALAADEFVEEKTRWYLPEAMVRHEGDADPKTLRIPRVRSDSMEPEMGDGDRLLADTARRLPATGELFVLFDGDGLVVKRVEMAPGESHLRLLSANLAYGPYTVVAPRRCTSSARWSGCSGGCCEAGARRLIASSGLFAIRELCS